MTLERDDNRPDPQALLQSSSETTRGKLKLFLGSAPGVGKTYAMLTEATEKRKQGLDVIVGWVDTHGRKDTEAALRGLEVIPRKKVVYNGFTYETLDVKAIIQRRPVTVVIDEMPHSNPPNSLHKKRWQDIEEILDLGINVYSALNIQHIDSLNAVVARVTGVDVTETIPDSVFDRADEVRLVDLPPDDLILRLEAGKIYLPGIAEKAKQNYFKRSNLIALRELTLRFMASRVDSQIKLNRQTSAGREVDDTAFGLLLIINKSVTQDTVRQAMRMARSLSTQLHCVCVERGTFRSEREEMAEILQFAATLGATTDVLVGDFALCICDYARTHNLSTVIWIPTSVFDFYVRRRQLRKAAPELNLLILSQQGPRRKKQRDSKLSSLFFLKISRARGIVQTTISTLLLTALLLPLDGILHQTNLVMFYLLLTLFISVRYGIVAATYCSVLSVLCFDITMVNIRGSFAVQDFQYLITFASMLVVGITSARLVTHRQEMSRQANIRERQTRMLYDAARSLSPAIDDVAVYNTISRIFIKGMSVQSEFWRYYAEDNEIVREQTVLKKVDEAIIRWCIDHNKTAGMGTHTLNQSPYLYVPFGWQDKVHGVVVLALVNIQQWTDLTNQRLLKGLISLTSQTLERLESVEDARQTLMNMEAERLRHSLIQSLSHDLRTPLTSLMTNAEALRMKIQKKDFKSSLEEANALVESSARMIRLLSNLLEMARLQSNEITLKKDWIPADELIGNAKANFKDRIKKFHVIDEIAPDCPLLYGDAVLLDRLLCNFLDNAFKYCKEGSTIVIEAKKRGDKVTLSVSDNGPGLPKGNVQRLFDPFRRGQKESKIAGVGLGLAICKTIARVHDADLIAIPSTLGGACFMLALPIVEPPEMVDEDELLAMEAEHEGTAGASGAAAGAGSANSADRAEQGAKDGKDSKSGQNDAESKAAEKMPSAESAEVVTAAQEEAAAKEQNN